MRSNACATSGRIGLPCRYASSPVYPPPVANVVFAAIPSAACAVAVWWSSRSTTATWTRTRRDRVLVGKGHVDAVSVVRTRHRDRRGPPEAQVLLLLEMLRVGPPIHERRLEQPPVVRVHHPPGGDRRKIRGPLRGGLFRDRLRNRTDDHRPDHEAHQAADHQDRRLTRRIAKPGAAGRGRARRRARPPRVRARSCRGTGARRCRGSKVRGHRVGSCVGGVRRWRIAPGGLRPACGERSSRAARQGAHVHDGDAIEAEGGGARQRPFRVRRHEHQEVLLRQRLVDRGGAWRGDRQHRRCGDQRDPPDGRDKLRIGRIESHPHEPPPNPRLEPVRLRAARPTAAPPLRRSPPPRSRERWPDHHDRGHLRPGRAPQPQPEGGRHGLRLPGPAEHGRRRQLRGIRGTRLRRWARTPCASFGR